VPKEGRNPLLLEIVLVGTLIAVLLEVMAQTLPPHYSPVRQPESNLAVGPYGYLEATSFFLRGALTLVFVVAFTRIVPEEARSRGGVIVLGISAIGKLVIAFAATDLTPRPETLHGVIHALGAVIAFFCGALGEVLLAWALRRDPDVRPAPHVLVGLSTITFLWTVIALGTLPVSAQIGIWGFVERIATALFLVWMLIVTLGLWNRATAEAAPRPIVQSFD
jgi:hypothetical protein